MHWPTLSTETHFQRLLRCFTPRPRSLHALLVTMPWRATRRARRLVCNDTRLNYLALEPAGGPLGGRLAIALGLQCRGPRSACCLSNRIEFVLCLLAATRLGAITVPLSVREQTPGLHYMLEHCGARLLVHDAELQAVLPAEKQPAGFAMACEF